MIDKIKQAPKFNVTLSLAAVTLILGWAFNAGATWKELKQLAELKPQVAQNTSNAALVKQNFDHLKERADQLYEGQKENSQQIRRVNENVITLLAEVRRSNGPAHTD